MLTSIARGQSIDELMTKTSNGIEEQRSRNLGKGDRLNWRLGKIHPSLTHRQPTLDNLRVIITLKKKPIYTVAKKMFKQSRLERRLLERKIRDTLLLGSDKESYKNTWEEKEYLSRIVFSPDQIKALQKTHQKIDRLYDNIRKKIYEQVRSNEILELEKVKQLINHYRGNITTRSTLGSSFTVSLEQADGDFLDMVAASPFVGSITPDMTSELDLDDSTESIGASVWWEKGLDGGVYDAGIIDSGIRADHRFLKYKNTLSGPPSLPRDIFKQAIGYAGSHGTRTAGIIASTHSQFPGVAFGLDALFDAGGHAYMSESEIMANLDWMIYLADRHATPDVINLSFSQYHGMYEYGLLAQFLDSIVNDLEIPITKSAGNQGAYQLGYPQSYNLISVANLDINENQDPIDDHIHISSSRGPTDSGRRKPDITAPGHNTMTTDSASSTSFANHTGTSAAAPHVAGALLLMAHSGILDPKAQKAVLINTAQTWSCNDSFEYVGDDGPAASSAHWDPTYGWGVLDLEHALYHLNDWHRNSVTVQKNISPNSHYKLYSGKMSAEDKATLVWNMRPWSSEDPAKLTNLDLWLYDEKSGKLLAKDQSVVDNVHQVSTLEERKVIIKVSSASSVIEGAAKEEFVLATEEGFLPVSPPSFEYKYSYPDSVIPEKAFVVLIEILNHGQTHAHDNIITLSSPPGQNSKEVQIKHIPNLPPGAAATVRFTFTAMNTKTGSYSIPMTFTSNSYGESHAFHHQQAIIIKVKNSAQKER